MCALIPIIICLALLRVADSCAYGPECRFPCRCGTGGCDPVFGECDTGECDQVLPTGHDFGWKLSGCRTGNIAYGKEATQRGQYRGHEAGRAVDGNTNPRLGSNSCAHPLLKDGQPAWWMVDLGKTYIIEQLVIFNRNSNKYRTNDFYIRIGNTSHITEQELCIYYNDGEQDKLTLTCTEHVNKGRYVSMERRSGSRDFEEINICEFVVIGYEPMDCNMNCEGFCNTLTGCDTCSAGYKLPDCVDECNHHFWGSNCFHSCGTCLNNQQCDKATGVCENGCEQWYLDSKCDVYIDNPSLKDVEIKVYAISSSSFTVTWRQDSDLNRNLEEYYLYRVSFQQLDGDTILSANISHESEKDHQSFYMDGLTYNTLYTVSVTPYRAYKVVEEAGEPSLESQNKTLCIAPDEPSIAVIPTNNSWVMHIQDAAEIEIGCDSLDSYDVYVGSEDGHNIKYTQSVLNQTTVIIPLNKSYIGLVIWTVISNNQNMTTNSSQQILSDTRQGESRSLSNLPIIIGCGVGAFVVTCIFIMFLVIRTKRRKRPRNTSQDFNQITSTDHLTKHESMSIIDGIDNVYANDEKLEFPTTCVPLPLLDVYIQQKQNEVDGFKHEYLTIPEGAVHPVIKASEGNNLIKNRFKNIKAYDSSRVVLDVLNNDPSTDYINACFIPGYGNAENYIAGQGPVPHTITETWRMIWQYNVTRVVMVTREKEFGKQKCERYWPQMVGQVEERGNLTVTLCEVENYTDFIIRKMKCSDLSETKHVTQFHFTSWPDKQALDIALPLLQFRHKVKSYPEEGPLFVHCSAGIGRTGTYVALDYLLDQGACEGKVDVHRCVTHMREYRMNMVQTLAQYESVYKALVEAFTFGDPIPCCELDARLVHMGPEIVKQHQNYTKWTGSLTSSENDNDGFKLENEMKNRDKEIIPDDVHRPYLKTPWKGSNDYINAVFINSYRRTRAYIVTQFPIPSTTADFWRLVYDHKCGVIVTLGQLETQKNSENNEAVYYNFANVNSTSWWPEHKHKPVQYGPIDVTTKNTVSEKGLSIRTYDVQLTGIKDMISTSHITLSDWSNDNLPQLDVFIELLKEIEQQKLKKDGPVLVQCLNGADKSGLLVAALYMTEYMKLEQQVDVVNAVRSVRRYRKQFVNTKNQYEFLYKVAQLYNQMFSTYANIM